MDRRAAIESAVYLVLTAAVVLGWCQMVAPVTTRQPAGTRLCPPTIMTCDLAELPRPALGAGAAAVAFLPSS